MPSDTDALVRSIRRWLLVLVFLLGIGTITLAHTGYLLTLTRLTFVDSLVFSVAGASGGVVALVAGLKAIGSHSPAESGGRSTE